MPKHKPHKHNPRICVVCLQTYTPTAARQLSCADCTEEFRKAKMPLWKKTFNGSRPEYNKLYQREYFKKHPEYHTYWGIRRRCKLKNIPFDLEKDDIKFPDVCPILGIPLYRNIGKNKPSGNSPSVDRIDPKGGYVKNNIQVISQRANIMKNDASPEELLKFADWVYKAYGTNRNSS